MNINVLHSVLQIIADYGGQISLIHHVENDTDSEVYQLPHEGCVWAQPELAITCTQVPI